MSKTTKTMIQVIIGKKKHSKKVDIEMKLDRFREMLREKMPESSLFLENEATIDKEDEKEYSIKDILKNNQVLCTFNTSNINIFLNDKKITECDINTEEEIISLIKQLGGMIPKDSKIKYDDTEITFDEAENEGMTIKDLSSDNSIFFIKEDPIVINDPLNPKEEKENFIHVNKNGEVIRMGYFDLKMDLSEIRELIDEDISIEERFLSKGIPVPLKDEKFILLKNIIKDNTVYITNQNSQLKLITPKAPEVPKMEKIILNFENISTNIIKASTNEKLEMIREKNKDLIPDNYLFTYRGSTINKEQENIFTLDDILDNSTQIFLKKFRPKMKFKIIGHNNSIIKELTLDPLYKLNELRSDLSLELSQAFTRDSKEIDTQNENDLTVGDIQKEGNIILKLRSINYSIFLNNSLILSQCFSPIINLGILRGLLSSEIPKESNFIHSTKQTPIPIEIEDNIIISKICDSNNNIFIESEQKNNIIPNKPLENAEFLRKENDLDIYLYPSLQFVIKPQSDSNKIDMIDNSHQAECKKISKELNRKIILVVGETGSGKTTLLNTLINALCGIQLKDTFRYNLINEYSKDSGVINPNSQASSRTSFITIYNIGSINGNPPITIIDTPGYNDTRGMDSDNKIKDMIKDLFNNWIDNINAICFVAKSSDTRLTHTQKYIFSSIISIFGNDIAENFVPMITFADKKKPIIIDALLDKDSLFRKSIYDYIKYDENWYFKFNNSSVFSGAKDIEDEIHWDRAIENFKKFIFKLNTLRAKSLINTKEVLEIREKMEKRILALRPLLDEGLSIMEAIRKEINFIKINSDLINKTRNFKIKSKRTKFKEEDLPPGIHTTTCLKCNRTCHNHCYFADNNDKRSCCSMDKNGYCRVCPNKCIWNLHKNIPKIIKYYEVEVEETVEELKKKYYDSQNNLSLSQQLILNKEFELEKTMVDVYGIQEEIRKCIDVLKQKALYPNIHETAEEYIDIQIKSEESEKKPGFKERIKSLKNMKENHKLINKMFKEGTTIRDFDEFRKKVLEGKISVIKNINCDIKLTKEEKDKLCNIF